MWENLIPATLILLISRVSGGVSTENLTNCTNLSSCTKTCNEPVDLPYTSTFCDSESGACICDCRDTPAATCTRDPDMDCNILCENKNPNPEVFTYIGSICPAAVHSTITENPISSVCVCSCLINSDYEESNDII